jgi:ParB family chromosome partitioning protein
VDLVPDGWCRDTVIPWADRQTADGILRRAAAQVDGLIAAYRVLNADTLELVKSRRYLEIRWGELLGPARDGRPSKTSHRSEVLDKDSRHRFRELAAHKALVLPRLLAATDVEALTRQALLGQAPTAQRGASGTGETEWYTPPAYVQAARDVLGGFDLDPASSEIAQRVVRAARYFTRESDGLRHAWQGRVWLNPPYAQPWIAAFAAKMVQEVTSGQVTEAIMLTHNYTDTGWFQSLAQVCAALCFPRGRIKFLDPAGHPAAPTQGQAFFYFGPHRARFLARFDAIGTLLVPPPERGTGFQAPTAQNDPDRGGEPA